MSILAKGTPYSTMRRSRRKWLQTALAIVLTAFMLFPFYMIVNYSLMDQIDILNYPPPLFPPTRRRPIRTPAPPPSAAPASWVPAPPCAWWGW